MATKRKLERRISSTEDMSSIVSTMKALAAVNVRIFQRARRSIDHYVDNVERGLQIALAERPSIARGMTRPAPGGSVGIFVFGSAQGMCGQFNDHIVEHAKHLIESTQASISVVAVGDRVAARMHRVGTPPVTHIPISGQASALTETVDQCIVESDRLRGKAVDRIVLCFNRQTHSPAYEPVSQRIFPLGTKRIREIVDRNWPSRQLPVSLTPLPQLERVLIRELLFSSMYRAVAHSLAAENAARLAAMQSAEENIDERLDELQARYNHQRQSEITEELLDIVGGYTALEDG